MSTPAGSRRHHSWGEFLALPENRSALRAARSLARCLSRPGSRLPFSPLVLHGSPGTGKSHLARTIAEHTADSEMVVTTQTIAAADLARAPAAGGSDAEPTFVDESLRSCDLLVLEDMHQLPAKSADAVCELLDTRKTHRRATVITMTAGPASQAHLSRRLTSRLAAGLVVPLDPLSPRSRRLLLRAEAKRRGIALMPDALDWLAAQPTGGGARPLLGMLSVLAPRGRGSPLPLDRKRVQELLAEAGQPPLAGPTPADIVKRVATAFGVKEKDLLGPSRLRPVLISRQVAMYLIRELTALSLPRIGTLFNGRDHTTVMHACRKVEEEIGEDKVFAGRVKQLRAEMG